MFEQLTKQLELALNYFASRGKLTRQNIQDGLKTVRQALLEADVNYKVVQDFISQVEEEAIGKKVIESVTPGQQIIKIVYDKLVELLGGRHVQSITLPKSNPTVIMLIGLQGSGKTTNAGKLALWLKKKNWTPALVALDVYRPAAVQQLEIVAKQVNVPCITPNLMESPISVSQRAIQEARTKGIDILILDTAGRLQIDPQMMRELEEIQVRVRPDGIFLVVDSMTGQIAVEVGQEFARRVGIDGFILTKLDGDAKGGAALSLRAVVGKPILFVGVGEKLDAIEPFYPERMASRILGMGDIVTLVEKAQTTLDEKQAEKIRKKLIRADFTLTDFLEQLNQIKRMGPISEIIKMLPGSGKIGLQVDEKELVRIEAIINSMTIAERENPEIIDGNRKQRIAKGSGTSVQEVNQLLKEFFAMKELLKRAQKMRKGSPFGGLLGFR